MGTKQSNSKYFVPKNGTAVLKGLKRARCAEVVAVYCSVERRGIQRQKYRFVTEIYGPFPFNVNNSNAGEIWKSRDLFTKTHV